MDWLNETVLWIFFWKVVNFVILAGIIVYLVRRFNVIDNVFGGYQRRIQQEIAAAAELKRESEQIQAEVDRAAKEAESRSAEILEKSKAQAEQEKAAIIETARGEAERMIEQARAVAAQQRDRQLEALQAGVVAQTLALAQEKVRDTITPKDHERLIEVFLGSLKNEGVRLS